MKDGGGGGCMEVGAKIVCMCISVAESRAGIEFRAAVPYQGGVASVAA